MSATTVPLDPSAARARELLQQELAKREYQASKPGVIDRLATSFWNWVTSLHFGNVTGAPALALAVLGVLVVGTVVVLLLVFGVPRPNRRSVEARALFGVDDARTADQLRASAAQAADAGDLERAIAESYRAIARALSERGLVTTAPGTTASAFGARASLVFPWFDGRITEAARAFDGVRYLDRPGTLDAYRAVSALDADLEHADADVPSAGVPA